MLPHSRGLTAELRRAFRPLPRGVNPGPTMAPWKCRVPAPQCASDGQGIALHGTLSDVLVERCLIHNAAGAFMKQPVDVANTTDHVFLRDVQADA